MNRSKSSTNPAELPKLNLNAAGIDVGSSSHFVAVPADRSEQPVQEFEAFTADLYRLADWLTECGVATMAMEFTEEGSNPWTVVRPVFDQGPQHVDIY